MLLREGKMMASLPRDRVSKPQEKGAFDNEAEPGRCHLWLSVKGPPQARVFGGGCGTSKRWDLAGGHTVLGGGC